MIAEILRGARLNHVLPVLLVAACGGANASPPQASNSATPAGTSYERIESGGLVGHYYEGRGTGRRPAVLVLGGSEGGFSGGQARVSEALAAEGYRVLHLAYFRAPTLPAELKEIPLEYFDQALAWLRQRPDVDPASVAVLGVSKGAEATLLIATRDPLLKAVVAGAPSSNVWIAVESCGVDRASSWTVGGKPLPALNCATGDKITTALAAYSEALKGADALPDTAIPIERSQAPVLLVCGEEDSLSPSCPMARRLVARGRPDAVHLLAYPGAGHAGFGVPVPRDAPNYAKLASLGGTPDGNAYARADSWPRVLAFLRERFAR